MEEKRNEIKVNEETEYLSIGVINLNNEGKVNIQLMLEEDLFTPLMKSALQNICNELQVLMVEVAKNIDERNAEKEDKNN